MPSSFSALAERFRFLLPARWRPAHPVVPVVRLSGVIGAVMPLRQGLSIAAVAPALERAFATRDAAAIAILINSPGGSAVQSHLILRRIRSLADEKKRRVRLHRGRWRVGRLYAGLAGDEISSTRPRSSGRSASYRRGSASRLLDRFGVERRVHTAGAARRCSTRSARNGRGRRSPQELQAEIHTTFVALVKARRGPALAGDRDPFLRRGLVRRRGAGARPRRRPRRSPGR